jgi:AcrR family transcriptional regulator
MPRSGAAARERLERAALELYAERGFDQTTAADIAARAGVTGRTFFRHFPDKREVLFDIERRLTEALQSALARLPTGLAPMAAVLLAFRWTVAALQDDRESALARSRIIAVTPQLQERELAKAATMSSHVAATLRAHGVPDRRASLAAEVGTTALSHAVQAWASDPDLELDDALTRSFAELRELFDDES